MRHINWKMKRGLLQSNFIFVWMSKSIEMTNMCVQHFMSSNQLALSIHCCGRYACQNGQNTNTSNAVMHTVMTFHQIFIDWIDAMVFVSTIDIGYACMLPHENAVNWTNIGINFAKPNVYVCVCVLMLTIRQHSTTFRIMWCTGEKKPLFVALLITWYQYYSLT